MQFFFICINILILNLKYNFRFIFGINIIEFAFFLIISNGFLIFTYFII